MRTRRTFRWTTFPVGNGVESVDSGDVEQITENTSKLIQSIKVQIVDYEMTYRDRLMV